MTATLLFIIVATLGIFAGAELLEGRRQPPATAGNGPAPDDMFAYTMYDDPC